MKSRRGSTIVLEQIFITIFSVMMLVMVLTTFANLRSDVLEFTAENQFSNVANYVHTSIVQAFVGTQTSSYGKVPITLPSKIGSYSYGVYLNNTSVRVSTYHGDISRSVPIANIDQVMTISGNVSSGDGHYVMEFNTSSNKIVLKGAYG